MKKMNLFEFLSATKLKRIVALMLAILMLVCVVGCNGGNEDGSSSDTPNSSQTDISSDTSNTSSDDITNSSNYDATSSDPTSTNSGTNNGSTKIDPLDGNIDVEYEYTYGTQKSDANEVGPAVDPVPLYKGLKGYAEKERNKRLDEILNTKNTLEYYTPKNKGGIYYVSTNGNDSNDGKTPETAIQSLTAIDGLPLKDGDAVLFERGCIWRMTDKLECREGVIYGSYGKGRKPMILGSPKNFAQETWKPSKKKNVWQLSYMYAYPCGVFLENGKEIGYKKLTIRELEKNTDFLYDEETATIYYYCDKGNPSNVYKSMEFSTSNTCLYVSPMVDRVIIDNICVRYTGMGAISTGFGNVDIDVTNCELGFTGGWGTTVRMGNGIGSWCSGLNHQWDHNWIYQTFDSGVSAQGQAGNHNYDNISISNNLFEYNNADIESWESGGQGNGITNPPSTYSNNHYDNNICRFTSLGWGTRADDGGIRGIDGVHYGHFEKNQIKSMTFNNNIIDCPGRMIYKVKMANKACYDNWERKNNVYYIKQSIRTETTLTYQFHWKDEETRVNGHGATNKADTINAFAEFEPDSKVYWYE